MHIDDLQYVYARWIQALSEKVLHPPKIRNLSPPTLPKKVRLDHLVSLGYVYHIETIGKPQENHMKMLISLILVK